MKNISRMDRINELIKREISEGIEREWDGSGLISLTHVVVSPDLHQANVYVSLFGMPKASDEARAMDFLKKNRARLQARIAKMIILKFTPILNFIQDKTMARADRVIDIIENLPPLPPETDSEND